jgi:Alpha/beta hydrolase family
MPTTTTPDGTEIYYKDWGTGQPIVFSHGWPLSAEDWDSQMLFFLQQGYRVIAHDRRGHGRSTQTSDGHDMDHYADDLAALTANLDLDQIVPDADSARLSTKLLRNNTFRTYKGFPHGMPTTDADIMSRDLLAFSKQPAAHPAREAALV